MTSTEPANAPSAADQSGRSAKPSLSRLRLAVIVVGLVCGVGFLAYDMIDGVNRGRKAAAEERAKQLAALNTFKQEADAVRGLVKPGDDLNDPAKVKQVEAATQRMVDAAGQVDQQTKPLIKALLDEFTSIGREVAANNKALEDSGGMDIDTLTTRQAAEQRIAALKRCHQNAAAIVQRFDALPQAIRMAVQGSDIPASKTDAFVDDLKQNAKVGVQKRLAQLDADACARMVDVVTLLRDEFGHWKSTDAGLTFSGGSANAQERFNKLAGEIQAISKEGDEERAKLKKKQ